MSLARATDDPALRQRYEDLALEFAQKVGGECDRDVTVRPLATVKTKPDSGDANPRK